MKRSLFAALALGMAGSGLAQQATIPLRTAPAASVVSKETLGAIRGIRALPDGRVIVNDQTRRRLLLFDASLASYSVLIDSTLGTATSYPRSIAGFIPYLGDSSIFVDYNQQTFLIFDEKGKVARVTAPPRPQDSPSMASSPGADAKGQILYRGYIRPPIPTGSLSSSGMMTPPPAIDSAAIVRADWDTGAADTLAKFKIFSGNRSSSSLKPDGTRLMQATINPLSSVDEWTVTADGRIAIVRGQDYHVDWIAGDGKHSSSPKMPYDWRRLTDDDKLAIIDSVRRLYDSMLVANPPRMTSSVNGVMTTSIMQVKYDYVPPSQMPDYYPALRTGGVLADRDGNVWILPYTSAQGGSKGLVYDVVNAKGELSERVQLPEGRSIVGFGKGGVVFMMNPAPAAKAGAPPGSAGFYLEKTTVGVGGTVRPSP